MTSYDEKLKFWKLNALRLITVIAAGVILLALLQLCGHIALGVATVVLTGLLVFFCSSPVDWFERRGMSRLCGTLATFLIVIVVLLLMVIAVAPAMARQVAAPVSSMPSYLTQLNDFVMGYTMSENSLIKQDQVSDAIVQARRWLIANSGSMVSGLTGGVLGVSVAVGNAALVLFVSFIAALWILIDLPKISRECMSLFNENQQKRLGVITKSFGTAFYGWARATFVCAAINGILVGICLFLAGIPYPTALGLAVGILYFIPYIGPVLMYILCGIVGLTVSPFACFLTIVFNFIINGAVCNFLSPKMMKDNVNVHPAITVIAIVIGGELGGMVGMLLAVPLVAALQTIFITFFEAHTNREICTEDGALFLKVTDHAVEDATGAFKKVKSLFSYKDNQR